MQPKGSGALTCSRNKGTECLETYGLDVGNHPIEIPTDIKSDDGGC